MPGRLYGNNTSTDLTAAQVVANANWGSAATVAITSGSNDQRGTIAVTASTTTPGANPTVVVTFSTAWESTPFVVVCKANVVTALPFAVTAVSTTSFTVTFIGTPVDTNVNSFSYFVVG